MTITDRLSTIVISHRGQKSLLVRRFGVRSCLLFGEISLGRIGACGPGNLFIQRDLKDRQDLAWIAGGSLTHFSLGASSSQRSAAGDEPPSRLDLSIRRTL